MWNYYKYLNSVLILKNGNFEIKVVEEKDQKINNLIENKCTNSFLSIRESKISYS